MEQSDIEFGLNRKALCRQPARLQPCASLDSYMSTPFTFIDPGPLHEGELELIIERTELCNKRMCNAPYYTFTMRHRPDGRRAGYIDVRIGKADCLTHYAGHIGYRVKPLFRGRRFAARACRLILPLFKAHDINPVWITCNPDNAPSRRTCERLGAEMIEIVDLPTDSDMYRYGERRKCRYRLNI